MRNNPDATIPIAWYKDECELHPTILCSHRFPIDGGIVGVRLFSPIAFPVPCEEHIRCDTEGFAAGKASRCRDDMLGLEQYRYWYSPSRLPRCCPYPIVAMTGLSFPAGHHTAQASLLAAYDFRDTLFRKQYGLTAINDHCPSMLFQVGKNGPQIINGRADGVIDGCDGDRLVRASPRQLVNASQDGCCSIHCFDPYSA